jgi:hypothetical protein
MSQFRSISVFCGSKSGDDPAFREAAIRLGIDMARRGRRLIYGGGSIGLMGITGSMHDRKRRMFELSDGFVVLPGGLGTLDETIEILTWKQLRLHDRPVVILDVNGYWQPLLGLMRSVIGQGFAHPAIADLYTVVDDADAVLAALEVAPTVTAEVLTSHL